MLEYILIFFVLGLLSVFYKVIKDVRQQSKCLEEETIGAYLKGELSSSERREVHLHLGGCSKCQSKMTSELD